MARVAPEERKAFSPATSSHKGKLRKAAIRSMANPRKDHAGERYGSLTAIRFSHVEGRKTYWVFRCDCGNIVTKSLCHVMSLDTKSCGCHTAAFIAEARTTHGGTGTRLYKIWTEMKERCYSPQSISYPNYGGREITVCNEWRHDFQSFFDWAMDNGYCDDLTIDRIDNNKGYAQNNCRWATAKEQANNRRSNIIVEYESACYTLAELSEKTGIKRSTLGYRLEHGYSGKDLTVPTQELLKWRRCRA